LIRRFLTTFVFGVLLTLIAANFYPFKGAPRLPSGATVVANGGRAEVFFVRLPEDRLGSPRSAATAEFPRAAFAAVGERKIVAELFRLRDVDGQVIGLATRLDGTVAGSEGAASRTVDWMLVIRSRGALLMSRGSIPADNSLAISSDWMGLDAETGGIVVKGTDEFTGLVGVYVEHTEVEEIDDAGVIHGVLTLDTRLRGAGI
jgi:hypothetical protein